MERQKKPSAYARARELIFACSGAADVGAISDRAARKLSAEGVGAMCCIAAIGARIPDVMAVAESASEILAIDGCELDCVKRILLGAGFDEFEYIRLTDHGMVKGETPATDERVTAVVEMGRSKFAAE